VEFIARHIGPTEKNLQKQISFLGFTSLDNLINNAIPSHLLSDTFKEKKSLSQEQATQKLKSIGAKNSIYKNWIGQGYANCLIPKVLLRHVYENPGWYTPYTPYQPEIAQGRLEALFNYQTMVCELTGFELANASLLDDATAAAEAAVLLYASRREKDSKKILVSSACHPHIISVVQTRTQALGIDCTLVENFAINTSLDGVFAILVQSPDTHGSIWEDVEFIKNAQEKNVKSILACDLLSLCLFNSPAAMGFDVAVGSSQRFGVSPNYGGPYAGFFATKQEHKRRLPGRVVGRSQDNRGRQAYRLALQTREQHIRRQRATSNICTAQALLANISGFYAIYHGPQGLIEIAEEVHRKASVLFKFIKKQGYQILTKEFFDTIAFVGKEKDILEIRKRAESKKINFCYKNKNICSISLDETSTMDNLTEIFLAISGSDRVEVKEVEESKIKESIKRKDKFLTQEVFNKYTCENSLVRYMKSLERKDISLVDSMIALGSCTMKLNAAAQMLPLTWDEWSQMHPFCPLEQAKGYEQLMQEVKADLLELSGFDEISLQPNSGAQGEYAGLLAIKNYLRVKKHFDRNVCLIPSSAHGTNPASAALCGMDVVVVACDAKGNIDYDDLLAKVSVNKKKLAALMITYPSTHGVFEENIKQICALIHEHGGQVYMDGANLNAQVGIIKVASLGADVCHFNLHKTFCIPHGGGGPGAGPIGVKGHLKDYLPGHVFINKATGKYESLSAVSASPWGSASLYTITWMYLKMMGSWGLKKATQVAILNANYIAKKLSSHYTILYKGSGGFVAHECIIDFREIKKQSGVDVHDVAKRLMDFGFHAPTVSWPVVNTLMIEPTESEPLEELDRFCEAMVHIKGEIDAISSGKLNRQNNPLKHAPHTHNCIAEDNWDRPYTRKEAVYPLKWVEENKYWPPVSRIDEAFGDRNFCCHL
jgi:glycine dehydrogenase